MSAGGSLRVAETNSGTKVPASPFEITDILTLVMPSLALLAALSDLLSYRIPNGLTGAIAATSLPVALLSGVPIAQIAFALGSGAVVLAIAFLLFNIGWFGGGDAKLAAGLACWFGPGALADFLVVTALLGGVLALVLLAFRALPAIPVQRTVPWIASLRDKSKGVPYGIALGAAAIILNSETLVWQSLHASQLS
ncbi:MAG: prepilin peptidase [Alsobacter sp.]